MGYFTDYELTVITKDENDVALLKEIYHYIIDSKDEHDYGFKWLNLSSDHEYYGNLKWYSFDEDMIALSKRFPDVLFKLEGEGESGRDMWKAYYLNGEREQVYAEIVFDNFKRDWEGEFWAS